MKHKAVFPSMEVFERGIEIPVLHLIFYEYFVRAAVGEMRWKANAAMEFGMARLCSPLEESFAYILLKNNYRAWLAEARMEYGEDFKSDYDPECEREGFKNVHHVCFLNGAQIDINEDGNAEEETTVLMDKVAQRYQDLECQAVDRMQLVRDEIEDNEAYLKMGREVDDFVEKEELRLGKGSLPDDQHVSKKRKLFHSYKEYTVRQPGEDKFKGWSRRGGVDLVKVKSKIEAQSQLYKGFSRAYRLVYDLMTRKHKRKASSSKVKEHLKVDKTRAWDLDQQACTATTVGGTAVEV